MKEQRGSRSGLFWGIAAACVVNIVGIMIGRHHDSPTPSIVAFGLGLVVVGVVAGLVDRRAGR